MINSFLFYFIFLRGKGDITVSTKELRIVIGGTRDD